MGGFGPTDPISSSLRPLGHFLPPVVIFIFSTGRISLAKERGKHGKNSGFRFFGWNAYSRRREGQNRVKSRLAGQRQTKVFQGRVHTARVWKADTPAKQTCGTATAFLAAPVYRRLLAAASP